MKRTLLLPLILLAAASSIQAQSVTDSCDSSFIGITLIFLDPQCPMDFDTVTNILVFGYTSPALDPIEVNGLNLVFDPADDEHDPIEF